MERKLYKLVKKLAILYYRFLCLVLPVNQKRVVFDSSLGKSYAGNPKYIYEYLVANGYDIKWDCIWFYEKDKYNIPGMSRQVQYGRMRYLYYMATAKIWVFDNRQPEFLIRRKDTYYIQTWHGTPLKKLALDMEDVFMVGETDINEYKKHFAKNVQTWDYLISQNAFSSETFARAFDFHKKMLEIGYPRNDILYADNKEEIAAEVKKELGIPEGKRVILYAPTWRDNQFYDRGKYKFTLALDLGRLQKEFGEDSVVLLRTHYYIADILDLTEYEGFVYNGSQYEDVSRLYLASDICITDYSSVFFDFANLKRPMLFFAYDYEDYADEIRGMYMDMEKELPGPILRTNDAVVDALHHMDAIEETYKERYEEFYERFCSVDDGHASERVIEKVFGERENGTLDTEQ